MIRTLLVISLLVLAATAPAFAQEAARPLAESDIVQLLEAGVTPARAATLVEQRGVSFELTPEIETRLRQAGGDDALLAAVTRAAAPPEEAIRRLTLAELRAKDGERGAALSELAEAAKLAPHWTELHYRSGLIYESLRQYKQAIAAWRRYLDLRPEAVRRDPGLAYARYNLGRLLWVERKDSPAAIAQAREAVRIAPDNTWHHWLLGSVLSDAGQLDEARRELQESLRIYPDNAVAHWNLGVFYERQGDRTAALREYREAARLEPDNQFYKDGLANAEKAR